MTVEAHFTINAIKAEVLAATTDIARFGRACDPEGNKIEVWEPKR